jgi:hypothetical protein
MTFAQQVGVVCPGSNPEYPIYVSMQTTMVFAWELSKDFIGQYYGPGLDLLNLTEANPSDYRKLVLAVLEVISTDSLTIMRGQHLSRPPLSMSVYFYANPDTGKLELGTSTFAYVNGTLDDWPEEAVIYGATVTNLVSVVNDAVNLDLGSSRYQNIFRNASALSNAIVPNLPPPRVATAKWAQDSQSFYYGQITPPYRTWAEMLLRGGGPVTLGNLTGLPQESAMVTSYLCPTYQVKQTSSLLASVFVGSATMALSVWGVWRLFTAFVAKRIMEPRESICVLR